MSESEISPVPVPDLRSLRSARVPGSAPLDIWDPAACAFSGVEGFTAALARPRSAPSGGAGESDQASGFAVSSSYEPYVSVRIPRHPEGYRIGRQTLAAASSRDVVASALASPLAVTALVAAATLRAALAHGPARRVLNQLAGIAPRKGGEIDRLVGEYCARNAEDAEQAVCMAMRDFYACWFAWSAIRTRDGRVNDLWGSVFCLTTALDYVDEPDDAGGGGYEAYLVAASEGLACLGGAAATAVLREIMITCAFMKAKEHMVTASARIEDPGEFVAAAGGPATPRELMRARWWDAAIPPLIRSATTMAEYAHLSDSQPFRAADRCPRIKRALDSLLRYNEIADLVSDDNRGECLSEVLHALALGGTSALAGYGHACARAIDDVLECGCGHDGHEEAAEMAMAAVLTFAIPPRYVVRAQLVRYTAAGGQIAEAYERPPAGSRLRQVAHTRLEDGDTLHSPGWQPLWSRTDTCAAPIDQAARRAVRRILLPLVAPQAATACQEAARTVLAACDRVEGDHELRSLAAGWCRLLDAAISTTITDAAVRRHAAADLRPLVARIWQQIIIPDPGAPRGADERLYIDVDRAMRRTWQLPHPDGITIRRAFLGVIASAIELAGLGPYTRLVDGAAHLLADASGRKNPVR